MAGPTFRGRSRRWPRVLAAGTALVLAAGACTGDRSRERSPETPEVPSTGFRTMWETDLDSLGITLRESWRGPLVWVIGETVILTGTDGTTVGVDLRTGSQRWSTGLLPVPLDKVRNPPTEPRRTPSPSTGYDEVTASALDNAYVTGSAWTVALDPTTGEVLWAEVGFEPIIGPDFPYFFFNGEEKLHRVDPRTQDTLWSKEPNASDAAVADDRIISVADGPGGQVDGDTPRAVIARSIDTGDTLWQADGPASPVDIVADGRADLAVTLDDDGRLLALDLATGTRRWESSALVVSIDGQPVDTQPRLLGMDRRSLFVGVQDRGSALVAISLADGAERWRIALPWQRKPLGSVDSDRVLVSTPDYFQVLDARDGAVTASRGDLAGTAVLHDDVVCAVVRGREGDALSCMELT